MVEEIRTLGFRVAFALGLGTMIAAGVFSLSGIAVNRIERGDRVRDRGAGGEHRGGDLLGVRLICSENGGGYPFTSETFEERDLLSYGVDASLFLGYTGTTAFYLVTMDEWFSG